MGERLSGSERRIVLLLLVVAVACVFYTRRHFFEAFPEASIELRYSKAEITARAEKFLKARGLSTRGFRQITLFDPDEEARMYLERELGLAEANRLMREAAPVWRWRARWFRPPHEEEFVVFLSPDGRLLGFRHVIPERQAGARLDRQVALRRAESFLKEQSGAAHSLIEERQEERPNRLDHVFTWEQQGFRAKDATLRRRVVVQGAEIGRYEVFLHLPEAWKREFAGLRSRNELYAQAAQFLYLPLVLAAIGVLLRSFRARWIPWRPLLILAGTVGALMVITQWNSLPFFIDSMPTSSPFRQSVIWGLLQGLGAGVGVFIYVLLAAAAGEPLYRELRPRHLSLRAAVDPTVLRTKGFFLATVAGYAFAAIHIAFVVAFYLVGRRFGVWTPQEIHYSDFLSTRLPWLYPLTISLLAATSEEFWFRLFAISWLKRRLRSTWPAVIIPALIWGFLHANYPQQPPYIRGIEVGLIGVAAGWLMLRFGILATLVWHYAVDAVLIGMFLIRAESWYFQLSGWLVGGVLLLPLAYSVTYYLRRGGFASDPRLFNDAMPAARAEEFPLLVRECGEALRPSWSVKRLYWMAAVVSVGLFLRPVKFGDFIRIHLSRTQAERIADEELRRRGVELASWRRGATFVANLEVPQFEYLRRAVGARPANELVRQYTQTGLWMVRYLRPLEKEEWRVLVDQNGRLLGTDHILDERAPGPALTTEEARLIAERYLEAQQRISAGRFRLVESKTEKRERRSDHYFVWEDPSFRTGEARARVSVSVVGDEPSEFRRYVKLPEEWLRQFERPHLSSAVLPGAIGAAGLWLLVVFVRRLGERSAEGVPLHHYHWRAYVAAGAFSAAAGACSAVNRWPEWLSRYDTAQPLENYWTEWWLGRLSIVAVVGFGAFLIVLAADVFLQRALGDRRLPQLSFWRSLALCGMAVGGSSVIGWLWERVPGPRRFLPLWDLTAPASFVPAVTALAQSLLTAIWLVSALAIAVSALARLERARTRRVLVVLAPVVFAVGRAETWHQFLFWVAVAIAALGALVLVIRTCAADLVTFGVALFWAQTVGVSANLLAQPSPWFRWNGLFCLAGAAAVGYCAARFQRAPAGRPPGAQ